MTRGVVALAQRLHLWDVTLVGHSVGAAARCSASHSASAGCASTGAVAGTLGGTAVAVQVSRTFGSRQEKPQWLCRVLRPRGNGRQAHFYTVVSREPSTASTPPHRQRFLAEQGYAQRIVDTADLTGPGEVNGPYWVDEPAD
jgi:pimeloyl-ACP methyl ester carboxylesterase